MSLIAVGREDSRAVEWFQCELCQEDLECGHACYLTPVEHAEEEDESCEHTHSLKRMAKIILRWDCGSAVRSSIGNSSSMLHTTIFRTMWRSTDTGPRMVERVGHDSKPINLSLLSSIRMLSDFQAPASLGK